jgi:hypothetical protein
MECDPGYTKAAARHATLVCHVCTRTACHEVSPAATPRHAHGPQLARKEQYAEALAMLTQWTSRFPDDPGVYRPPCS